MTLTETQRIGHTMQELVWRPARQVKTKSVAGMVAKAIIVGLLALLVLIVAGLKMFYTNPHVNGKVKLIVSVVLVAWVTILLF